MRWWRKVRRKLKYFDRAMDDITFLLAMYHSKLNHGGRWQQCTDAFCADERKFIKAAWPELKL